MQQYITSQSHIGERDKTTTNPFHQYDHLILIE